MAHYKIGVYLKVHEIVPEDPMYGMTQKAFGGDFYQVKNDIISEMKKLAVQLESYLRLGAWQYMVLVSSIKEMLGDKKWGK